MSDANDPYAQQAQEANQLAQQNAVDPGCLSGKAAAASIKQKFRPRAQCRPGADMFDGQKHPALSVIQPNEGGADPGTPVQNNQKQEKTLCKTCNNGGPVLS